jgi:uncharacterized membrane protein YkvA (DUF1232 family)
MIPLPPLVIGLVAGTMGTLLVEEIFGGPKEAARTPEPLHTQDRAKIEKIESEFLPHVQLAMLTAAKEQREVQYGAEGKKPMNWQALLAMLPSPEDAVAMYFALLDSRTSWFVKGFLAAALIYLVSPVDVVPDELVPVAGWIDDSAVIAAALAAVEYAVTPAHRILARVWLEKQAKWVTGLSYSEIEDMVDRIRTGGDVGPQRETTEASVVAT